MENNIGYSFFNEATKELNEKIDLSTVLIKNQTTKINQLEQENKELKSLISNMISLLPSYEIMYLHRDLSENDSKLLEGILV